MPWICEDCGSTSLQGTQSYTEWGYEEIYFDHTGEILDWGDREATDSDGGDWDNLECQDCGSVNVSDVDDEDFEEILRIFNRPNPDETRGTTVSVVNNWKEIIEEEVRTDGN